jgi:hypothetical protein
MIRKPRNVPQTEQVSPSGLEVTGLRHPGAQKLMNGILAKSPVVADAALFPVVTLSIPRIDWQICQELSISI